MHLPFSLSDLYFSHGFKSIGVPMNLKEKILTKDLFWSLFLSLMSSSTKWRLFDNICELLVIFPWRKSRCFFFYVCLFVLFDAFFCCFSLVFLFACFRLRKFFVLTICTCFYFTLDKLIYSIKLIKITQVKKISFWFMLDLNWNNLKSFIKRLK